MKKRFIQNNECFLVLSAHRGVRSYVRNQCLGAKLVSVVLGIFCFSAIPIALSGCGEPGTGLVLTIHSGLQVPAEVDALRISISVRGYPELVENISLTSSFPHTLGIDLASGAGLVDVDISALKEENEVSSVLLQIKPILGDVVRAQVEL